jgi:type I restriction enzyme S subunit
LPTQEEFAQVAREIEDYKKQQYQEIKYAEDLFQSLLQKAFTGELTSKVYGG